MGERAGGEGGRGGRWLRELRERARLGRRGSGREGGGQKRLARGRERERGRHFPVLLLFASKRVGIEERKGIGEVEDEKSSRKSEWIGRSRRSKIEVSFASRCLLFLRRPLSHFFFRTSLSGTGITTSLIHAHAFTRVATNAKGPSEPAKVDPPPPSDRQRG